MTFARSIHYACPKCGPHVAIVAESGGVCVGCGAVTGMAPCIEGACPRAGVPFVAPPAVGRLPCPRFAVFVLGQRTDEPIAVFAYSDQAQAWGRQQYPGRHIIVEQKE